VLAPASVVPAEIVFTRTLHFLPASQASTRVSLSKAALAELMPPPYLDSTRHSPSNPKGFSLPLYLAALHRVLEPTPACGAGGFRRGQR